MTLFIRPASFVTVRHFENRHFKVLLDFEPFSGGHISLVKEEQGQEAQKFSGNLEAALANGYICTKMDQNNLHQIKQHFFAEEERAWLQEINDLITWGQDNSFWLHINEKPELSELELEGDEKIAVTLEVSAI